MSKASIQAFSAIGFDLAQLDAAATAAGEMADLSSISSYDVTKTNLQPSATKFVQA